MVNQRVDKRSYRFPYEFGENLKKKHFKSTELCNKLKYK